MAASQRRAIRKSAEEQALPEKEAIVPFLFFDPEFWWRNPKHAVTTEATIVEASRPRFEGVGGGSQTLVADVRDPETGQLVRSKSKVMENCGGFRVGQTIRVRWSAKLQRFREYDQTTAPKQDWLRELNTMPGVQVISTPGTDPGAALEKLQQLREAGIMSDAQLAQVEQQLASAGSPTSGQQSSSAASDNPVQVRLENLDRLRGAGVLDESEYKKQRQRILDSL